MSLGANAEPSLLWHANYKINGDHGFNFKVHIADVAEVAALAAANDIGARLKVLMAPDCEIKYATLSKDNSQKDGLFLNTAVGIGGYVLTGLTPPPATFDNDKTCVDIRLEDENNKPTIYKIPCIPDDVIAGGLVLTGVAPVNNIQTAAPPASVNTDTWVVNFNKLIKALMFYTNSVKSGHPPGGAYNFFKWKNGYATKVGVKKGGRVFV